MEQKSQEKDEHKSEENSEKVNVKLIRLFKIIVCLLLLLVVGLALALSDLALYKNEHGSTGGSPEQPTTNTDAAMVGTNNDEDEVNLAAMVGTHTGRMRVKDNETEAEIDYSLACLQGVPHRKYMLNCRLLQVGCATVKMGNDTADEECLMEDMEFTFKVDRNGNFHTNDSELFDPVRLAAALYSKHLRVPAADGKTEERDVARTNSSHAIVSLEGLTLEVMELPESLLKKSGGGRKRREAIFAGGDPSDVPENRDRWALPNAPVLKGAFGESFKNTWRGGPLLKITSLYRKSGREGVVKYDFSLTNFEILLSSLPDIRVISGGSKSSGSCTMNVQTDFSQNKQCRNVIQSRVRVYLNAHACVWWFCFARARKDNYVTLDLNPLMEVAATLTKQPGNNLQYSFQLQKFHSGTSSDIGGVHVGVNLGMNIGTLLFGVWGFLGGFLVDRYLERVVKKLHDDYKAKVPGIIDKNAESLINGSLPKAGSIPVSSSVMDLLHLAIRSCNNMNVLTAELSKIGGLLQHVPAPFQPNRIACTGTGRIAVVHDGCMHDSGRSGSGDSLEIYCYGGSKRFCLSKEMCPWRNHRSPSCTVMFDLATCSVGGLDGVSMATTWGESRSCRRKCRGRWFWRRCSTSCSCSGTKYRVECNRGSVEVRNS